MTEFNKEQFFADMEAALRADDVALADNDNAHLIKEMDEKGQLDLAEEMLEYLTEANENQASDLIEEFIEFTQQKIAMYHLSKAIAKAMEDCDEDGDEDSVSDEDGATEEVKEVADTDAAEAEATVEGETQAEEVKAE